MKKILVLIIALTMVLSLSACGGVDKTAVTEAFNSTNTVLNEAGALANDNLDKMDSATMDALTEIANKMQGFKDEIESDELTQERADEIIDILADYPATIAELKAQVEALIAGGGDGMTEDQAAALLQINTELTEIYNKYAEHYDSFDDETKGFVDEIALTINDINSVLESISLNAAQADVLIEGSQQVLEAAVSGWAEIEAQLAE